MQWLESLAPERRLALARAYADAALADGAYVITPEGAKVPIPPILTPHGVPRATMAQVSADAHALTSALTRLTADLMLRPGAGAAARKNCSAPFGPLEAQALESGWAQAEQLATVRVDFLVDAGGRHRALELNATIPAMQGYSDAIAAAFLRAVARERGLDGEKLIEENGRNSDDLLHSLEAHHARLTHTDMRPLSIAIVARNGDAQRGELEHYARRWSALGHIVLLVSPAEVRIEDGRGMVGAHAPDLFYRHIFARRLDPAGDFARMCLDARALSRAQPHRQPPGGEGDAGPAVGGGGQPAGGADRPLRRGGGRDHSHGAVDAAVGGGAGARSRRRAPRRSGGVDARAPRRPGAQAQLGLRRQGRLPRRRPRLVARAGARADRPRRRLERAVRLRAARPRRLGGAGAGARRARAPSTRGRPMAPSGATSTSICRRSPTWAWQGARRAARCARRRSRIVNILGGGGLAPLVLDELLAAICAPS